MGLGRTALNPNFGVFLFFWLVGLEAVRRVLRENTDNAVQREGEAEGGEPI